MTDEGGNKRYLVAFFHFSIICTQQMTWLSFSPVSYRAATFYNTTLPVINGLSMMYLVEALPFGILAMWALEKLGLRMSLLISAWLTVVGTSLRLFSTFSGLSDLTRIVAVYLGQFLVSAVTPLAVFSPAKTTSVWFPADGRTLANALINLSNPIGVMIVNSISPQFVDADGELMAFWLILPSVFLSIFTALLGSLVMSTAKMDEGKNGVVVDGGDARGQMLQIETGKDSDSLWVEMKKLFQNRQYVILLLCCGGGIGLYSVIIIMLGQILCPFGYTNVVSGLSTATLTASGVFGSVIICWYCDYSKKLSQVLKCCYFCVTVMAFCFFVITWARIYIGTYILFMFAAFGFPAMAMLPIGLELAAETTFPISPPVSTGLIQQMGTAQGFVLAVIVQKVGSVMSTEEAFESGSVCKGALLAGSGNGGSQSSNRTASPVTTWTSVNSTGNPLMADDIQPAAVDYTVSVLIICICTLILCLLLAFAFTPSYNRRKFESQKASEAATYDHGEATENHREEQEMLGKKVVK